MLRTTVASLISAFVLSSSINVSGADDPIAIFNGKDLAGWRYGKEDLAGKTRTADGRFAVQDGVIVAEDGEGTT